MSCSVEHCTAHAHGERAVGVSAYSANVNFLRHFLRHYGP